MKRKDRRRIEQALEEMRKESGTNIRELIKKSPELLQVLQETAKQTRTQNGGGNH